MYTPRDCRACSLLAGDHHNAMHSAVFARHQYRPITSASGVDLAGILGDAWADTKGLVGDRTRGGLARPGLPLPTAERTGNGKMKISLEIAMFW